MVNDPEGGQIRPLRCRDEFGVTLGVPVRVEGSRLPFSVGAWDAMGQEIVEARLDRGGSAKPITPEPQAAQATRAGSFIFGGVIQGPYGHFLIETLARAWALIPSSLPIIWLGNGYKGVVRGSQGQAMDILGIDPARHVFMTVPTRFERLVVPEAGAVLWRSFHPEHARAMGAVPFAPPVPGKRVWLSRSKISETKARVVNEAELEALLIADGWTIMHPEDLDIRGQLAVMRDAETLAGFDGSAFHTLVLAGGVAARLILIPRAGAQRLSPTFQAISNGKGLEQRMLCLDVDIVDGARRNSTIGRLRSVEASFLALRDMAAQPVRARGALQAQPD